jgi:hypothetical protein
VPDDDELYLSLSEAKETLHINIELASPSDLIPEVPGWEDRSIFIAREGKLDFYHFDPYSQALSKLRRGHDQDLRDVGSMFNDCLINADQLVELFVRIKPLLYRYPVIDQQDFEKAVFKAAEEEKLKRDE